MKAAPRIVVAYLTGEVDNDLPPTPRKKRGGCG